MSAQKRKAKSGKRKHSAPSAPANPQSLRFRFPLSAFRFPLSAFRFSKAAFSLVEIVLALGVVAFSVIAILGLFPVALDSARESQRQTTATLIAQSVFSEIKTTGSSSTSGTSWKVRYGEGTNDWHTITPTSGEQFIVYTKEGSVLGKVDAASTFNGTVTSPANAIFGARIKPQLVTSGSGLVQMNVNIETPMLAGTAKRTIYTFTTLIAP